jgi:hypothetical protein
LAGDAGHREAISTLDWAQTVRQRYEQSIATTQAYEASEFCAA